MAVTTHEPDCPDSDGKIDGDYADWEGWSVLHGQGIYWWFKVTDIEDEPHRCSAYEPETKSCEDWMDPDYFRPVCRYWPFNPKDIVKYPQCGFRFERQEQRVCPDRAVASILRRSVIERN